MSTNLIDLIAKFLTPDMIARIASGLGIDRNLAQKAIDVAIPALLARLAAHASKPDGARQLSNVLTEQGPDALVNLRNAIDGPQRGLGERGWNLWSALLGDGSTNALSAAIGKYAGIGEGTSKSLVSVLGPVVMGVLGQQQRSAGLDASGLAALLASQKDEIAAAIPSGLAKQLCDRGLQDAGDALRLALRRYPEWQPAPNDRKAFSCASRMLGAISLSIANHLPAMLASYVVRPVKLPPGRAKLAINPKPIGLPTLANTTGIVLVCRCNATAADVACARITSGCNATSSLASADASANSHLWRICCDPWP
jgi:hypothetical protein